MLRAHLALLLLPLAGCPSTTSVCRSATCERVGEASCGDGDGATVEQRVAELQQAQACGATIVRCESRVSWNGTKYFLRYPQGDGTWRVDVFRGQDGGSPTNQLSYSVFAEPTQDCPAGIEEDASSGTWCQVVATWDAPSVCDGGPSADTDDWPFDI